MKIYGQFKSFKFSQGDIGGPLVIKDIDGIYTQVGISSILASSTCTNAPNGFTRVTSFLGWISANTGIAIAP
jgi:secreted trypsin-like serine protease